jgi:hypothetical protein
MPYSTLMSGSSGFIVSPDDLNFVSPLNAYAVDLSHFNYFWLYWQEVYAITRSANL